VSVADFGGMLRGKTPLRATVQRHPLGHMPLEESFGQVPAQVGSRTESWSDEVF